MQNPDAEELDKETMRFDDYLGGWCKKPKLQKELADLLIKQVTEAKDFRFERIPRKDKPKRTTYGGEFFEDGIDESEIMGDLVAEMSEEEGMVRTATIKKFSNYIRYLKEAKSRANDLRQLDTEVVYNNIATLAKLK
ncbi:MAG: hypothetical protein Nk1A_8110 [Endomicrobiia bacterium]|nr:MAG: hypothetical protein Nk1A_8110 [Endomicrobiia bacterium]